MYYGKDSQYQKAVNEMRVLVNERQRINSTPIPNLSEIIEEIEQRPKLFRRCFVKLIKLNIVEKSPPRNNLRKLRKCRVARTQLSHCDF